MIHSIKKHSRSTVIYIFTNDLLDICNTFSNIFLCVDDVKLFKHINSADDSLDLQQGTNAYIWTNINLHRQMRNSLQ